MNAPAVTVYLAILPFEFLHWWAIEAPIKLFKILRFIFASFAHLFSLKELFTTFFQPWKNEYREGLVRTGIVVGVVFKSLLIIFDLFILSVLLIIETAVFASWFALPVFVIFSLYGAIFA